VKLLALVTSCVTALVTVSVAALVVPSHALAQTDWPQKPVTLVVPYPPGGVNDAVARVLRQQAGGGTRQADR
jgi:tripartite-type tricarboxylate transporter receptor subunit TctC